MSTTLWKLSGDLLLVKPSQFLPVNRASTSDHDLCLARAASAVAKNCFSEIWVQRSKVNGARQEAGGRREAASAHLEGLPDVGGAAEGSLRRRERSQSELGTWVLGAWPSVGGARLTSASP